MVGDLEDAALFVTKQQTGRLRGANCSNPSVAIVMILFSITLL